MYHKRYQNAIKFSYGSIHRTHLQIYISGKKLTGYQILYRLYTILAYMYNLIKDIKYKF